MTDEAKEPVETDNSDDVEETEASAEETSSESSEETVETVETKEETWLVPGKFKTPDDLKQSYEHLESLVGRQSSELHNLRQAVGKSQDTASSADRIKRFAEEAQKDPVAAIERVAEEKVRGAVEESRKVQMHMAYQQARQNPDFVRLEPVMTQVAQQYSEMIDRSGLRNDPQVLNILYNVARGIEADQREQKALENGKRKGEAAAAKKAKARVEGSSSSKGFVKKSIKNMTSAQIKDAILKGELEP